MSTRKNVSAGPYTKSDTDQSNNSSLMLSLVHASTTIEIEEILLARQKLPTTIPATASPMAMRDHRHHLQLNHGSGSQAFMLYERTTSMR